MLQDEETQAPKAAVCLPARLSEVCAENLIPCFQAEEGNSDA
jgi:hypothetical protein